MRDDSDLIRITFIEVIGWRVTSIAITSIVVFHGEKVIAVNRRLKNKVRQHAMIDAQD